MDSNSESEDEIFFGPITEREMMIRIQKGISENDRFTENEEVFKSEHSSTGEENICSNHSLAVSEHPNEQTSEWSGGYYCDTLNREKHISDQSDLYTPVFEENCKNLTSCIKSDYSQLDSVDGYENGNINDNNLSASITNAIHDGENEYGEFDNTLKSIEELENSFTQITFDDSESTYHLSSVTCESKIGCINKNNCMSLTNSDESKNVCFAVSVGGKSTELFNNFSDTLVNDSCSLEINNSVRVTNISNHVVNYGENVRHSNQNEFDSNSVELSKIIVEPVPSDSTLSFKTCNTRSDSTIVSTETSDSAFSVAQCSNFSNTCCSLVSVSAHKISSDTERNSIFKLCTDKRTTSEVLFENLSINNSVSVTDLQINFDIDSSNNKSEKKSSDHLGMSELVITDLNNKSLTTVCEVGDKMYDLQNLVHTDLKSNAQETNNIENDFISHQDEEMENGESDINGKADFCNIECHDTEEIYNEDVGSTEVSVVNRVPQLKSVDITTKKNERVTAETVYVFKPTETIMKEAESSEVSSEIMQKMNDKTPSELSTCETESFKDFLVKANDDNTMNVNVCGINEHTATVTGNMALQSDSEIINNDTEINSKIQNNPDNITFKPTTVENVHTNLSFSETCGTSSNEILCADNIFSSLSKGSYETASSVNNSYKDACISSNENLMADNAYTGHDVMNVIVNKCEGIYELKDNSLHIANVSSNQGLSSKAFHSNHGITDFPSPFFKNIQEHMNSHYKNRQTPSRHVSNVKIENICEGEIEKSVHEKYHLDFSEFNEVDQIKLNKTSNEIHEAVGKSFVGDVIDSDFTSETEIRQTAIINHGTRKQREMQCDEEPMDISYGDLSIKNTEQWNAYRLTLDLDASLLGDIITETEFKEVLDSEEAIFNCTRNISKGSSKHVPDSDIAVADNGSLQKSNQKRNITSSASKLPKQQKSLIKTPVFQPKTDTLTAQRKWALHLASTKPKTTDTKNTVTIKNSLSSQKDKFQKPNTAPKLSVPSICREPKSQSKLKQENTVSHTAKRKIELTKSTLSPNNLKKNERFKQIESPVRAYINNSPSSMTSKMSSHENDTSLLENKIAKPEFKSTEKKVSQIPMLRTPRLQVKGANCNPKRKVDTTENVDPNRGSHRSIPRVKESPCSKLPRYNDKFKKLIDTPLKLYKPSEKDDDSQVLQDKANYEVQDLQTSIGNE